MSLSLSVPRSNPSIRLIYPSLSNVLELYAIKASFNVFLNALDISFNSVESSLPAILDISDDN